jgi:hypothetical protein
MLLGREIHSPSYNKYTFFKHNVHEIYKLYKSFWWKIHPNCCDLFREKKHVRETIFGGLSSRPRQRLSGRTIATIVIKWNMIMGFKLSRYIDNIDNIDCEWDIIHITIMEMNGYQLILMGLAIQRSQFHPFRITRIFGGKD